MTTGAGWSGMRRAAAVMARRRTSSPGLVVDEALERGQALGTRVLRVGVVDVEARPVGEDRVGQVGLDHRCQRALTGEAAGVVARRLVLEVPADLLLDVGRVGVDQDGRRGDRVLLGAG